MAEKQRRERNDYILIRNLTRDFQGMCDEMKEYYEEIVLENKDLTTY